jgi:hypothetical protein
MIAGWVAGSVRARAMARRRLGLVAARRLAGAGSLAAALAALADSPYHRAIRTGRATDPTDRLAGAQREVAETLLWNLRVLAGWLPATGAERLRRLTGWFEIANVDEHLRALAGRAAEPPYRLGTLSTAWPRLAATGSAADLRAVLAASPWGDPGGTSDREITLGMRLAWGDRVAARVPAARPWVAGAVALAVARERFATGAPLPDRAAVSATRVLGPGWSAAATLAELAAAVPPAARWALAQVAGPADLWQAELRWWRRLGADGERLLAGRGSGGLPGAGFGPEPMLGAAALLAADTWLVRGALELAARGGAGTGEVFDALA